MNNCIEVYETCGDCHKIGYCELVQMDKETQQEVMDNEMVQHPNHYNSGKYEVIDVIDDWKLGFYEGNIIKYVARAKHKGNEVQDLKKAKFYLDRLIELVEGEK